MVDIYFFREIFYVSLIAVALFTSIIIYLWQKNNKEKNRLREYDININADMKDSISDLLESLVSECFNEYILLNVEYKDITYVNAELEAQIMKGVGEMVAKYISPVMLTKMSVYYNLRYISEIISDKVYIVTLNYVLEKNAMKDSEKE